NQSLLLHPVSPRHRRDTRVCMLAGMTRALPHLFVVLSLFVTPAAALAAPGYAWQFPPGAETLEQRIPAPPGFTRPAADPDSWAAWLRGLPMKPVDDHVLIYT